MANGWAGENAVNEQIDATVEDALARARAKAGASQCPACGSA
jgi:hypothetical protein